MGPPPAANAISAGSGDKPQPTGAADGAAADAGAATQPAPSGLQRKNAAAEPPLPASILAERGFGLAAPQGPILPEDSLIGPLQDWRSPKAGEAGALKVASAFLDALVAGKLEKSLVAPGRLPLVTVLTRELLAEPRPASYRIGVFSSEDGKGPGATAKISLAYPAVALEDAQTIPGNEAASSLPGGPEAAAEGGEMRWLAGEIGLRQIDGIWYIESVTFADFPS